MRTERRSSHCSTAIHPCAHAQPHVASHAQSYCGPTSHPGRSGGEARQPRDNRVTTTWQPRDNRVAACSGRSSVLLRVCGAAAFFPVRVRALVVGVGADQRLHGGWECVRVTQPERRGPIDRSSAPMRGTAAGSAGRLRARCHCAEVKFDRERSGRACEGSSGAPTTVLTPLVSNSVRPQRLGDTGR